MESKPLRLSGWGRFPTAECRFAQPLRADDVPEGIVASSTLIARGNGRSYGDSSLNREQVVGMCRADRLLAFDETDGALTCEAGVLLADLIDIFLPRGWFVPVTPGTKLVTIGGMIAADIHGKNHHGAGSFGDHLLWIDLALADGSVARCSPTERAELFAATCGGMGLTGVILRACFRMLRVESARIVQRTIRAPDLDAAIELFEANSAATYSVAWVDCLAQGRDLGRSAVLLGEHARAEDLPPDSRRAPFRRARRAPRRVPFDFPRLALSRLSVTVFNELIHLGYRPGTTLVDLDPYFYPLDAIHDWNRIYGRRGFVQYQCVLPLAESQVGLRRLLDEIVAVGNASFLTVLKRMGAESFGLLSFPMPGYTLALDFPASPETFALLDRLDAITAEHRGRLYLAKDARMGPAMLAGYPRLDRFRAVRAALPQGPAFASLQSTRLGI